MKWKHKHFIFVWKPGDRERSEDTFEMSSVQSKPRYTLLTSSHSNGSFPSPANLNKVVLNHQNEDNCTLQKVRTVVGWVRRGEWRVLTRHTSNSKLISNSERSARGDYTTQDYYIETLSNIRSGSVYPAGQYNSIYSFLYTSVL